MQTLISWVAVGALLYFTVMVLDDEGIINLDKLIPLAKCDDRQVRVAVQELYGQVWGASITQLDFSEIREVSSTDVLRVCQVKVGQDRTLGYEVIKHANGYEFYVQLQGGDVLSNMFESMMESAILDSLFE